MNDRYDKQAKLIAETFQPDWSSGPAAGMARRAAAHARRRRILRNTTLPFVALAAIATAFVYTFAPVAPKPVPDATPSSVAVLPAHVEKVTSYQIISDEELIHLLRDRPLLILPQGDGANKFVVLDL